jgi:hypothetical protein
MLNPCKRHVITGYIFLGLIRKTVETYTHEHTHTHTYTHTHTHTHIHTHTHTHTHTIIFYLHTFIVADRRKSHKYTYRKYHRPNRRKILVQRSSIKCYHYVKARTDLSIFTRTHSLRARMLVRGNFFRCPRY